MLALMTKLQAWEKDGVPEALRKTRTDSSAAYAWFTGIRMETWLPRCFEQSQVY